METTIKILPPLEGEEPIQYCIRAGFSGVLNTWKQIAEELNVDVPATQSARIAIERASRQTRIEYQTSAKQQPAAPNALTDAIISTILPFLQNQPAGLDEVRVLQLIKEYTPAPKTDYTVINLNGVESKITGKQHNQFSNLIKLIGCGINVYLYGPSGTGKTQLAENVSKVLSKNFYCLSVGNQTTKSDLMGFISATGQYITTSFRKAFEEGGIFLLDEIDSGNANVLTCLNSALANGVCSFPDGMIKKHPEFICIAAANTFGTGADRVYVGRNALDEASLNRFVKREINYDEDLEREISPDFCDFIKEAREILKGERLAISTRNMIHIDTYYKANGCSKMEAVENTFYANFTKDIQDRLRAGRKTL